MEQLLLLIFRIILLYFLGIMFNLNRFSKKNFFAFFECQPFQVLSLDITVTSHYNIVPFVTWI